MTGVGDWIGINWIASGKPELSNGAGFAYDDLGRLVSFDPAPAPLPTQLYQYDAWGNITKKGAVEIEYPNPTVAANGPHKTNRVKVGGSFYSPTHDANGNRSMTFAGGMHTGDVIYDAEDRISSIGLSQTEEVSFVYDAGGQQKIKVFSDGMGEDVTKYYSPQIEVRPDGSTIKSYFFGGTRVASVVESDSSWQQDYLTASTWESGVEFATQWGGAPVLLVTVSQGAITAACWATALLAVALFLLPAGRRRRAVVGLRLRRGPAILLAIVVFTGTTPWPLLVQPAEAQCSGCDCPPAEWPAAADVSYFHYDHIGSPLLITNGAGEVVEHIRYDPYGAVRGRYNAAGNPIGEPLATDVRYEFTGYEAERNSGLLYANARFFDTELGTFLTHDPAAQFWNPYTYVGWDPVNGTDSSGALADWAVYMIIGAVIGFAVGGIQAAINGASFGDALLAGLVSGAIGAVSGAILGPLGTAANNAGGWIQAAYLTATLSYGTYGVYQGIADGQYFATAVGAVFLALGLYNAGKVARGAPATEPPGVEGALEGYEEGPNACQTMKDVARGTAVQTESGVLWNGKLSDVFFDPLSPPTPSQSIGRAGAKLGMKASSELLKRSQLSKQLMSKAGVAEILETGGKATHGAGTNVDLVDAGRLALDYGGSPGDWAKVTSTLGVGHVETHAYRNVVTGEVVEWKSILPEWVLYGPTN